ncbi:type I-E CRISPR-associated protein Cas6/Cse3/CasE [Actinomycetaceae bacterium WB03_NA08]|uniref:Type I-E CRISPR-associated protein Cas6/Cse3/CasE n=1 Tax=Scrofimicrobium canadense TaxID=2652290 RepID=A0A6N7W5B8_9ACTO|nr:type I-E CRISPR-associated protein Cas6/Cse3/CasE [Scrofimicrobium canadense]MSS84505.1 type I-E CRISPR-associated protein Cas6/Cse3/CasE [Scrofimicrobium canadense]
MWLTSIELSQRERRMTFDTDMTHRFLTLASNSSTYLWASPRPGKLIVQSESALNMNTIKRVSTSVFAAPRKTNYQKHEKLTFAAILNPVKRTFQPEQRGKLTPLSQDEIPDWFVRKIGSAAKVNHVDVQIMSPAKGNRPDGTRMIHTRTAFTGTMTVNDPKALSHLLTHGVGRAKRFGCGLLLTEVLK